MNQEIMEMIGDEGIEIVTQTVFMDRGMAALTVRDYCCSVCWGFLEAVYRTGYSATVQCRTYGTEHGGFVTKYWAEKQRQLNMVAARDAKDMLRKIGIIENENAGKSEEQLLKELGF